MNKPKWEDAPEWANWLAMDENGDWWFYKDKPVLGIVGWRSSELSELYETNMKYDDNVNWEDTLEERPND